jgi:putative peptidoglycan lipid II flippase
LLLATRPTRIARVAGNAVPEPEGESARALRGRRRAGGGALAIAAGIGLSRVAGLIRERVIAHYLGLSPAADAFRAALRIPNLLQTLLGEGVLSASFIPVYARLCAEGRQADASRVARSVGSLLALVASSVAALGVLASDALVDLLAPGFSDSTRALTVRLVRIMFPGTALLVLSAWCLGVLNSHRRFFLSYVSPVLWNAVLIATTIVAGRRLAGHDDEIAVWLAWGTVAGSAAQLLVQLPSVIGLLRGLSPALALQHPGVRSTLRTFGTVVLGRGSVQISAYVDQLLASFLGPGLVAAMSNAQTLYLLPVSLFGMAISAAELPEMATAQGDAEARARQIQERLASSLRRVLFLVVPSAVAFVAIGDSIITLLFQTGRFTAADTARVWIVLCGSALGIVASTQGRLLASAFYADSDGTSALRVLRGAQLRVILGGLLGWLVVLPLRHAFGYDAMWGALGLTATSSLAAWIEWALLRRWLATRLGGVPSARKLGLGALAAALLAGAVARGAAWAASESDAPGWLAALAAVATFGVIYLGTMALAGVPEITRPLRRFRAR